MTAGLKTGTVLCPLEAVPQGTAKGVSLLAGSSEDGHFEIIIWHHLDGLRAFENSCPHLGMPLETFPDRFLTADGASLICSTHGALFDTAGTCFSGPCKNQTLKALPVRVDNGNIVLA